MDAVGASLQPVLVLLASSVFAVVACRYFQLPPIVGYLAVGLDHPDLRRRVAEVVPDLRHVSTLWP